MIKAAAMPGRGKHDRRHDEIDRRIAQTDADIARTDRELEDLEIRMARVEAKAELRRKKVDGS